MAQAAMRGFAGGVSNRGVEDRQRQQEQSQFQQEQMRLSMDAMNTHISSMVERTDKMMADYGVAAGNVAQRASGGSTGAEVTEIRKAAMLTAQSIAQQLDMTRQALEAKGVGAEVFAGMPTGAEYIRRRMNIFDQGLSAGISASPTEVGLATAEEKAVIVEAMDRAGFSHEESLRAADIGAPGSMVNIKNETESAFRTAAASSDVEALDGYRERSRVAAGQRISYEQTRVALESGNFITGTFGDSRKMMAQLFELAGFSHPPEIIGSAATAELLDAAANQLGVNVAKSMSRVTNLSLQLIKDSLPALSRSVGGNLLITEILDRIAQRDIQVGMLAEKYRAAGTMSPEGQVTFFDAITELDKNDPVIDAKLEAKIREQVLGAPGSFANFQDWTKPFQGQLPPGVPPGSTFSVEHEGIRYYKTPEGKNVGVKVEEISVPEIQADPDEKPEAE